jgi:hypothetical protein
MAPNITKKRDFIVGSSFLIESDHCKESDSDDGGQHPRNDSNEEDSPLFGFHPNAEGNRQGDDDSEKHCSIWI